MAIRRRSINEQGKYTDYAHLKNNYDESNIASPSHKASIPTSYTLKTITFEDVDQAVFNEFNLRFRINEKDMPVLLLDADISSLMNQNYVQFDKEKGFINLPIFTMVRVEDKKLFRTSNKRLLAYTIPKQKANGIVYEEYYVKAPQEWLLTYELVFVTNYREYTNQMQKQMAEYFGNKANIVVCQNERFPIRPIAQDIIGETEMLNRDESDERTLYVTTYKVKVWALTRDEADTKMKERPNTFQLDINVTDAIGTDTSDTSTINIERFDMDLEKFPEKPE